MSGRTTLLGPQRLAPTLSPTLASLGVPPDAPVATVTAGWQEREPDDAELDAHLDGRSLNLGLYGRVGLAFERDRELETAFHARQATLRRLQALHRVRLDTALAACHALLAVPGDDGPLDEERRAALEALRDLDRRHLERVREVHAEFEARWRPGEREPLAHARAAVAGILGGVAALAIAGGHVAVLLNRLRLLDVGARAKGMTVVAWSAGAMAASETVVLFHDDPPHGPGHPETFEIGMGLAPGVVPLPHARHRLRLDDAPRVAIAARRFAPSACVPMDEHARMDWDGARWIPAAGMRRLGGGGDVPAWDAA
ncbi:MAG: hypothetical protein ACRENJ_08555 [Candidatus Eiseniibacteriota bacterium]